MSISYRVELVVGQLWNTEYNAWFPNMFTNSQTPYKFHYMAKINWRREIRKFRKYILRIPDEYYVTDIYNINDIYYHPDFKFVDAVLSKSYFGWDLNNFGNKNNYDNFGDLNIIVNDYPSNLDEIIRRYPDNLWNWAELSRYPGLTWEIIQSNPDKPWNSNGLEDNKFTKQATLSMAKHRKRVHQRINYLVKYVCLPNILEILKYY